ncbi:MAG: hypothetical protein COA43_12955 [Robiginitomaculum sp.]|nr:MAG: hypothetical protein COA43_12955 [Robiginitomaculum sp.]
MKILTITSVLLTILAGGCASIVSDAKLAVFANKTSCDHYIEMFHNNGNDFAGKVLKNDKYKISRLKKLGYTKALKKNNAICGADAVDLYEVVLRDGSREEVYVASIVKPQKELGRRKLHNFGLVDGVMGEVMLIEPKNMKAFK